MKKKNNNLLTVSVFIPVYNAEKTIIHCLTSLKKQTYRPMEILIINDGSTDNTIKLIKEFKSKNRSLNIKIVNLRHIGITGKVFNIGLRKCKGQLILKLDPDMWLDPNYIELLAKKFSGRVVGCQGVWGLDSSKKYSLMEKFYVINRLGNLLYEDKIGKPGVNIYKNIKGLQWEELGYGEDIFLLRTLRKKGMLKTVTDAKIYHQEPKNFNENIKQAIKYGKYKYISLTKRKSANFLFSEVYFLVPILITISIFFSYAWIITGILLVYLLSRLIFKISLALKNLKKHSFFNLVFYVIAVFGLKIINSYITLSSLSYYFLKRK